MMSQAGLNLHRLQHRLKHGEIHAVALTTHPSDEITGAQEAAEAVLLLLWSYS